MGEPKADVLEVVLPRSVDDEVFEGNQNILAQALERREGWRI